MTLFASGSNARLGHGVRETWHTRHGAEEAWSARVVEAAAAAGVRAHCALSFAPGGAAVALFPELDEVVGYDAITIDEVPALGPVTRRAEADEDGYARIVSAALSQIATGQVAKVVLGRQLHLNAAGLRPEHLLAPLLRDRPGEYVFSQPLPDGAVVVGASPELLIRRSGQAISSVPLAGSVPRSDDAATDAARAEALTHSTKDLTEHAYVVEQIVEVLAPYCQTLDYPERPILHRTDTLWHLATPIHGVLRDDRPAPSALRLAQLLHPTPAVGGVPTARAAELIAELEPDDRGFLAGCVGWTDGGGDGEFAVTIRAGVIQGDDLTLFAGAGIVAGSDPQAEVRETGAKLGTMLRALERNLAAVAR